MNCSTNTRFNAQAQLILNPSFIKGEDYGEKRAKILNQQALEVAQSAIEHWPNYQPTPLVNLPSLAAEFNVANIAYKDEGSRFGLGSFKGLGGAYAVARQLCRVASEKLGRQVLLDELNSPQVREVSQTVTVSCATDGNHGRSVAWGAKIFGCRCTIFIHATVSEGRKTAIEQYGAQVIRTQGNYDDAVRQADEQATQNGWYVISDTSYPGYMDIPKDVMQGYQVMVQEASQQWQELPTHVFIQAGVGGFASAVLGWFWERLLPEQRPCFIVAEPQAADCLYQSAKAQTITAVGGELNTLMAGLACGEVSHLAWEFLATGANAFAVIEDQAAINAMRLLAAPTGNDPLVIAGESAVAGLAAALAILQNPQQRTQLGINAQSRLFFIGSEADTDPVLYEQLVGQSSAALRAAHSPK